MLEGIDVSAYQGFIDWHSVKVLGGKTFAFIKASEGLSYQDPDFQSNWLGARTNGLVRGAYHLYHASLDAVAQSDYLHAYVRSNGHFVNGDFIVIDVEEAGIDGQDTIAVCNGIAAFIQRCLKQINKNVILYTNPNTWLTILGNPTDSVIANCPLWLADYGPTVPTLANWPQGLSFWQYSDTGRCPGIQGNVDLSRFYGSYQQLIQLSIPPP